MTSIGQLCSRIGRLALSPSINMSRPSLGIKRFTTSVCQCGHLSSKTFSDKTQLLPSGISALGSIPPSRTMASLGEMLEKGVNYRKSKAKHPTFGKPFLKGLVLKVIVKKPKKPNSANRKCVRVRLSNGKEVTAYIPGEGHNLQEHHIVLVRGGNVQDLPGVKFKCVRGKYDLAHVVKKS